MYTKEGNVNMSDENERTVHISLRKRVFFPPWILLIVLVGISLLSEKSFLSGMQAATGFILDNFAWAFNLTTLGCLAVVIIVFVSPLGKVRIGGSKEFPKQKDIKK